LEVSRKTLALIVVAALLGASTMLAVASLMRPGPSKLVYTEMAPRKPSEAELPRGRYGLLRPLGTLGTIWALCVAASLLVYVALRRWLTLRGPVG